MLPTSYGVGSADSQRDQPDDQRSPARRPGRCPRVCGPFRTCAAFGDMVI